MARRLSAVVVVAVVACCLSMASSQSPGTAADAQKTAQGVANPAARQTGVADRPFAEPWLDPPIPFFARNLRQEFALPPLHDGDDDPAAKTARATQVFQRAQLLKIHQGTANAVWAGAADTVADNRRIVSDLLGRPLRKLTFDGTRLSQLNDLLATSGPAHVTVSSRRLQADTALVVEKPDILVDFGGAAIEVGPTPPLWLIQVVGARNVAVVNAKIERGINGVLVDRSEKVTIAGSEISGLSQNGVVVTGASSHVHVHSNILRELGRSGLMLHGPVSKTLLEDNRIERLRGRSNWHAGILLTGRGENIAANPDTFFLPDGYWVVTNHLVDRLGNPSENVVMDNLIKDNLSSGVYNDGAIANVFLKNRIEGNSKEGVCFDNGATANVFASNVVSGNGRRWGQGDAELALDAVLAAGRAADGLPRAKLPGISIDNAIFNEFFDNEVLGNYGGGVKMVRTAMFNLIGKNTIVDNNLGQNSKYHFFGIELGGAPADVPVIDLDFTGSSGNIVFGNSIRGKHYSGIFVGPSSEQNDLLDNTIVGVRAFTVERPS